jgi:hypothetical protein
MARYDFTTLDRSNCEELAPGLSACYANVRGTVRSPAYWQWRYLDGPAGESCLVVARREGAVVGMLGAVYLSCSVRGSPVTTALVGDLSIEPVHRRWACYAGILRTSGENPASRSVPFAFAFVTGGFTAWAPRLGCVDLGPVPVFTGAFSGRRVLEALGVPQAVAGLGELTAPLCIRTDRRVRAPGIELRSIEDAAALADAADTSTWRRGEVFPLADGDYLAWRYDACPDAEYSILGAYERARLTGFSVFRIDGARGRAYLAELASPPDRVDVLAALLAETFRRMAASGAGVVTASFPVWSAQGRLLADWGLRLWASPLWGMRLAAFPYDVGAGHPCMRRRSWFFSLGDWLTH